MNANIIIEFERRYDEIYKSKFLGQSNVIFIPYKGIMIYDIHKQKRVTDVLSIVRRIINSGDHVGFISFNVIEIKVYISIGLIGIIISFINDKKDMFNLYIASKEIYNYINSSKCYCNIVFRKYNKCIKNMIRIFICDDTVCDDDINSMLNLRKLDLSNNKNITDRGISNLINLTHINLNTNITSKGLLNLVNLTNIDNSIFDK